MAAVQIDMLHVLYRTIITVNSSRKVHIPDFRYPRPVDTGGDEVEVVDHARMRALMGGAG